MDTDQGVVVLEVLIANFIAFTEEAFLVAFTHVGVQLIITKEALFVEFANGMYAALNLLFRQRLLSARSMGNRWQVHGKDVWGVKRVLMSEDLLVAYANFAGRQYKPSYEEAPKGDSDIPHEFTMLTASMQFQIIPTSGDVVTRPVRAVESKKHEGVFHHFLSLKEDIELRVLMRNVGRRVVRKELVRRSSEDRDCLSLL